VAHCFSLTANLPAILHLPMVRIPSRILSPRLHFFDSFHITRTCPSCLSRNLRRLPTSQHVSDFPLLFYPIVESCSIFLLIRSVLCVPRPHTSSLLSTSVRSMPHFLHFQLAFVCRSRLCRSARSSNHAQSSSSSPLFSSCLFPSLPPSFSAVLLPPLLCLVPSLLRGPHGIRLKSLLSHLMPLYYST